MQNKGGNAIADKFDDIRVNERISASSVRLISNDGEQLGIVSISDALDTANREGLDLVEVASNADPTELLLLVDIMISFSSVRMIAKLLDVSTRSGISWLIARTP